MNASEEHLTNVAFPDVRISVHNFGPIANGTVDLRPLTVFVGPSNTGKTYFAILVYALHRILNGFPRLPVKNTHRGFLWAGLPYVKSSARSDEVSDEDLQDVLGKLQIDGRPFSFSDLPTTIRDLVEANIKNPGLLGTDLLTELHRCFDLESVSNMVRVTDQSNEMTVSLGIREGGKDLWNFRLGVLNSDTDVATDGQIEDMNLFPEGWPGTVSRSSEILSRIRHLVSEKEEDHGYYRDSWYLSGHRMGRLIEEIIHEAASSGADTHYLPAARSGIMQSHRVIASSLVARSARAGLEQLPVVPTFSGVMADFLQRLILYDEGSRSRFVPQIPTWGDTSGVNMSDLADALERETLAGEIRTSKSPMGGYPEFVYRPQETEEDIRLSRASSMVSELAPVVLFLRGVVGIGDTLIIEEPEAHLHPAAQTQMAVTLARLVRAGVRIVVTTHSDWLLKEIGNLMREGELGDEPDVNKSNASPPSSLQSSDVGIWLFSRAGTSGGSTVEEIPFDRIEGVEPRDYEDVAEALYNRAADLQNRLEETSRGMKRKHE